MSLPRLRRALAEEGGTVARALAPEGDDGALSVAGPPQRAASGPRAAGREREYELLLEIILEGSLLHYGFPRVVTTEDHDLALLLGDQLYALGLSRLAALGDLDAVAELADLISLLAQAQAAGDRALAQAVWEAGATAIGWGTSPEHERAKELARLGCGQAARALRDAAGKALQSDHGGPVA